MTDFAVLLVGDLDERTDELKAALYAINDELRDAGEDLRILDHSEVDDVGGRVSAAVALAGRKLDHDEKAALENCIELQLPIFPVVDDLRQFTESVPEVLWPYNGYEIKPGERIRELVTLLLEALGLLRSKRKAFISYVRKESRAVAVQLHDALLRRWYRVFLDTHAIRPGMTFQDQLLHELADSDIVILLGTESVEKRKFVMEEIKFANLANIGGIQVILPPRTRTVNEALFFPQLVIQDADLETPGAAPPAARLAASKLTEVLNRVAEQRLHAHNERATALIEPLHDHAMGLGWGYTHHIGRYVSLDRGGRPRRIDVALGEPTSRRLQTAIESADPASLLYDPLGLTDTSLDHLDFLGAKLKVELLDGRKAEEWVHTL